VIAVVLDRFDRALVKLMDDPAAIEDVQRVAAELSDALLSHLAYEEDELLEPGTLRAPCRSWPPGRSVSQHRCRQTLELANGCVEIS